MIISNLVRYLIVLLVVLSGLLAFEVVVGAYFDASALLALTGTVVAGGLPFGLLTAGAIRLAGTRVGSPWVRMATVLVATGIPLLGVALLGVIVPDGGPGAAASDRGAAGRRQRARNRVRTRLLAGSAHAPNCDGRRSPDGPEQRGARKHPRQIQSGPTAGRRDGLARRSFCGGGGSGR